jgi:excisionase family DNA binding protein
MSSTVASHCDTQDGITRRKEVNVSEDTYLTVVEVAGRLRVSTRTVYAMLRDGHLRGVRAGSKTVRIPSDALDELAPYADRKICARA